MRETGPNIAARLMVKLREHAKRSGQLVETVHVHYVLERFLYRLGQSPHRDRLILKGGMLMMAWHDIRHRSTRDLDFLGLMELDADALRAILCDVFTVDAADPVRFDAEQLKLEPIRENAAYPGLRALTRAFIGKARVKVVIDIGIGDSTAPGVVDIDYPTLLDSPTPRIRGYARETVMAEKFEAIVKNGKENSRMKDFYDLWRIFTSVSVDGQRLALAVFSTFRNRGTGIPEELPVGLTAEFAADATKLQQWAAFVDELDDANVPAFKDVVATIAPLLMNSATAARALHR